MRRAKVFQTVDDETGEKLIRFRCPGCDKNHILHVIAGSKPPADFPTWSWNGSEEKPTFRPSVLVNKKRLNPEEPICHSFITDGQIKFLNDCTHELAGQTIELPWV